MGMKCCKELGIQLRYRSFTPVSQLDAPSFFLVAKSVRLVMNRKSLSVWCTWRTWQIPVQPITNGFHGNAAVWLSFNFSCFHEKSPQRTGHVQFRRLHVFKSVGISFLFIHDKNWMKIIYRSSLLNRLSQKM